MLTVLQNQTQKLKVVIPAISLNFGQHFMHLTVMDRATDEFLYRGEGVAKIQCKYAHDSWSAHLVDVDVIRL